VRFLRGLSVSDAVDILGDWRGAVDLERIDRRGRESEGPAAGSTSISSDGRVRCMSGADVVWSALPSSRINSPSIAYGAPVFLINVYSTLYPITYIA
jgi:hypothetical protein